MSTPELVVLCNADGTPTGSANKAEIHSDSTPLHLAFSAWLFDDQGNLLITRRALGKLTWPGVWTNSFCGHPAPGEKFHDTVRRRALEEIGLEASGIAEVRDVVPDFRYRAVDSSGVVENEICPVFAVRMAAGAEITPNPEEVDSFIWVRPTDLLTAVDATPWAFSPWLVSELADTRLRSVLEA
ncbi:isopentenyl-diphosphate Delta-isomerase [Corynebacterium breve]|uniref:Isopentenyl-diphosphate Delta-isomerase n=1 Tax=Corynebacterium breve TaxID=3049799 RepID=A0ABY8VCE1_9CORY|nr:isopentenyl-diphosphate Delta-isomerase [Corynebacterium breve]WIM67109.1 isopentenyl-diphosphate Delta-isomerase [Corynebacterium breve]